jgi:hypothetical protein
MRHTIGNVLLVVAVTAFFAWPSTQASADITLVGATTPPCVIVSDPNEKSLERRMANQLASYLEQISGRKFKVQSAGDVLPERAIIVGAYGIAAPTPLGKDGFILKTAGQRLFICGGGAQGTAYGVFDFLQRSLDCRFWSWDEESVPHRDSITIGDLDVREQPAFEMHDIMSREAQNGGNFFVYKERTRSTLQFTGNHTMYTMLTPAAEKNPEFWPMDAKGKRAPNKLHFNYLAPGIDQALADALDAEVEKRKGNLENWIYFAGQGDWYGGLDQAPASKAAYAADGSSGPLIGMINRTAAILQQKHPGIKVGTFAYMSTDAPPKQTVPAENVYIWLPRLRYGTTIGLEAAASASNLNAKSHARSQTIKNSIEKWAQIAPHRLYIWEYGANYDNYVKPWPSLRAIAENIKYYKRLGVQGVMIQSNYGSTGGDLAVLKNWIWSQLLWNPDQDVNTLLQQFCDGYYGPASRDIQEYVNALENSVRTPALLQLDEFTKGTAYLTPEIKSRMKAALARAEAATQDAAHAEYYRRVREVGASLDSLDLWRSGPLSEKDGKLLRTDLNVENGGEYTLPRALEMMKYLRGSSKTEWGTGISQQRGIPAANGGPIYSLARGDVVVKIAPYQGTKRVWDITANGRSVIAHTSISPGSAYFEPVGTPSGDSVEIEGETGYANWKITPDHLQQERFTFGEDGALHWSCGFKQLAKGKPMTVEPDVGTNFGTSSLAEAQKVKFEIKTPAGWQTVAVKEHKEKGRPPFQALEPTTDFQVRVTLADGQSTILDTYRNLPATGYAAAWLTRSKTLLFYVQLGSVTTEYNKSVPAFERVLQFSNPAAK